MSFETEAEMLLAWRDFMLQVDADVITGYNIVNFDVPYLLNRAEHLKLPDFSVFGRARGVKASMKDTLFSSKAYGTRESKTIGTERKGK